jgi:hypothetical protein
MIQALNCGGKWAEKRRVMQAAITLKTHFSGANGLSWLTNYRQMILLFTL